MFEPVSFFRVITPPGTILFIEMRGRHAGSDCASCHALCKSVSESCAKCEPSGTVGPVLRRIAVDMQIP